MLSQPQHPFGPAMNCVVTTAVTALDAKIEIRIPTINVVFDKTTFSICTPIVFLLLELK